MYARRVLEMPRVPQSPDNGRRRRVWGWNWATILNGLGCRVAVVEMQPHILPDEDVEITQILERALMRDGITDTHRHANQKYR